MSKWNDRKKKDDEQNAQIEKPEESAVKDYSAGAIGKAYANTERPTMKTAQTPSFDEPSLTGVYGLQKNSKGESVMDMTGKTSGSLQGMKLALNNELTISGQMKLKQSLNKQIDSEQETRQKNANARNTAMLELAEMPLMGFDGQSINANTADAATVIRGINAIADDTLRARAAKAFKTLTQTEGSRFYGENADGVGTFLESANLTRDEYREAAEDYASRFYGDGKHDEEDAAAYLKARQEIEESAYSDYAKSQLTAALDKAYTGITGGETPSESAEGASAEAEDEKRATEEEQKKEKKPGFWSGLAGKVPEQEEQEKAESSAQAKAQSRIVSQTMTASTAPGFPTAGKANGKAPEVQGPVQMTPEERIVAQGGMSFAEWMATPSVSSADTSLEEGGSERTDETGAEIRMHEAQTIGEAADALLKGRYDQIEGAGKDELDRMLAESGNARRMIGTLTEADSQRIILGNDMADAVTYGNIAAQGQTVKTLYDVMKSDSFPDELRGDVMAQMVVWAAQAEAMEQAGTLGGDAELPLMERLLTTDEHAMDELASIYAARDELLFDKADMRRAQEEASAQAAYAAQAAQSAPADDAAAAADDTAEDDLTMEEETVDLSGFVATEAMNRLSAEVDDAYGALCGQIKAVFPALTDDVLATLKPTITGIVAVQNDRFELQYDRALAASGMNPGLNGVILREAYTMAVSALGLLILAAAVLFYIPLVAKMGVPRLIIGLFFILLCLLAMILGLSLPSQLSNTLVRLGMNGVLVLAMLPGIQCGISLNLGLPIGIIGGLIGGLLCIEFGMSGFTGLFFAIAVGLVIAAATGWLYGLLLNRLKGSEMSVTTYVGFSVVSLMCIAWLVLPFKSPIMKWPLGNGLRTTIGLQTSYRHVLNDFLSFEIFGVTIPTGLLLFFAACCLAVWLFMRSKTGIAMSAAGANPRFAAATGINVDRMRIIGTMLSTMLAAVGIIVYGQSYGFMQLYQAPRQMGFLAASAILIGGATTSRAKISNVVIGTFLFQGVLTLGMPVANALVPQSTISETLRILISNGIILYALTKSGGANRG